MALNLLGHLFCIVVELKIVGHANNAFETTIFEYSFIHDEWTDAKDSFSEEVLTVLSYCLQEDGAIAMCQDTKMIYTVSKSEVACIPVNLVDDNISCMKRKLLPRPHNLFAEGQSGFSAVVLNRNLYVMGGDGKMGSIDPLPSNLVIMFDPQENKWIRKANMLQPRIKMGAAVLSKLTFLCILLIIIFSILIIFYYLKK